MAHVYKDQWKSSFLEFTVRPDNVQADIRELLNKLKPEWKDDVTIEKMQGGILNFMYRCGPKNGSHKDFIVARIYNRPGDLAEMMNPFREVAILEKVGAAGLGPELLTVFTNGVCYKYTDGEVLTVSRIRSEELIPFVTRSLAKLHKLPLMDDAYNSWDIADAHMFLAQYPPPLKNKERLERLLKLIPDKEALDREIELLVKRIQYANSPKVFCHSDTKGENFIWNAKEKILKMIDFEHSGNGHQAQEIGGHFVSYNDVQNPTPGTFPDKDFQVRWIREYLEYYFEETGRKKEDVTDKDVERLRVQTNIFAQMSRLFIGVGLCSGDEMGFHDSFEFCYCLLQDYFKYKAEVDAMVLPD